VAGQDVGAARITQLPNEIDIASCGAAEAALLAAVSAPGLVIADMTGTACCDSIEDTQAACAGFRWPGSRGAPSTSSRAA
jgi:hypothetical protein